MGAFKDCLATVWCVCVSVSVCVGSEEEHRDVGEEGRRRRKSRTEREGHKIGRASCRERV